MKKNKKLYAMKKLDKSKMIEKHQVRMSVGAHCGI
jgi:hypothetical protein